MRCRMISTVKKTPGAECEHDIPAKLQSLGESEVQHLYIGIIHYVVAPRLSGRQEAAEREKQRGDRRQRLKYGRAKDAKFCRAHVISHRFGESRPKHWLRFIMEQPQARRRILNRRFLVSNRLTSLLRYSVGDENICREHAIAVAVCRYPSSKRGELHHIHRPASLSRT